MSVGTRQYRYSYTPPDLGEEREDRDQEVEDDSALVINVRCPSLSSGSWCYKLYGLVLAGLGLIISFIWVCFHLYVLSQTTTMELRMLRLFIILFMTSSLGVIVLYWSWYTYYSYDTDSLVYDDQTGTCLVITVIFLVLLGPVCLHYRNIELHQVAGESEGTKEPRRARRSHRLSGRDRTDRIDRTDRSPPPKYQETVISHPANR